MNLHELFRNPLKQTSLMSIFCEHVYVPHIVQWMKSAAYDSEWSSSILYVEGTCWIVIEIRDRWTCTTVRLPSSKKRSERGGKIEKSGTKKNRESGIRECWMSAIALMPLFTEKCYSSSLRQTGRCSSAFTTCVYLHRNSKLMLMLTVHARVLKKKNTSMCMYSSAN